MSKAERDAVAFTERWHRDHPPDRTADEVEEAEAPTPLTRRELHDRLLSERKVKGDKK